MSLTGLVFALMSAAPQQTAMVVVEGAPIKDDAIRAIEKHGYKVDDQSALFAELGGGASGFGLGSGSKESDKPLPASAPKEWEEDWKRGTEICRERVGVAFKAHAPGAGNLEQSCFYGRAEYFLSKLAAQRKPDVVFRVSFSGRQLTVLKYVPGGPGRQLDRSVSKTESPAAAVEDSISQLEAKKGAVDDYPERRGLPELPRRAVATLEPKGPPTAQQLPKECKNTLPAKLVLDSKSTLGGALEARWVETVKAAEKPAGDKKCALNARRQYEKLFGVDMEMTIVELDCGDAAGFASGSAGSGLGKGADDLADAVIKSLASSMCGGATSRGKW